MSEGWPWPRRYRDLTIIDLDEKRSLVVACDSAGAIGPKQADVVKVPGYVLGRLTTRVALMEVLAVGAQPVCVVNTLCVEPDPTGREIYRGVADELGLIVGEPEKLLTGSAEKNVPTSQSGLGITVVGLADKSSLRLNRLQAGDFLAVFGLPKVGGEVQLNDPEIVDLLTVIGLLSQLEVREIVPVGSRGIAAEAYGLAGLYGLNLVWDPTLSKPDLGKSAGPSTCVLAAGSKDVLESLGRKADKPFAILGCFQARPKTTKTTTHDC